MELSEPDHFVGESRQLYVPGVSEPDPLSEPEPSREFDFVGETLQGNSTSKSRSQISSVRETVQGLRVRSLLRSAFCARSRARQSHVELSEPDPFPEPDLS